jgi:hypothetical protein
LTWRHGFRDPRFVEARRQVSRFIFQFVVHSSAIEREAS